MARLPPLDPAALDAEQKAVHDAIAAGPRGSVRGPLAVWLRRPGLASQAQALGRYCRFDSSLSRRLSELAILVTARAWGSEFEWWAHKAHALDAGLAPGAIEAIRTHQAPRFTDPEEQAVYDVATTPNRARTLDDALYARALAVLGEGRRREGRRRAGCRLPGIPARRRGGRRCSGRHDDGGAVTVLRGLTWDHPRGCDGLAANAGLFAAAHPGLSVTWDRRSLKQFGDQPIEALADRYDLIVVDHPFMGDAARTGCLLDLRALALDLKSPGAHGIVRRLAAQSDVVVQNFRPGVMRKLGFGYEDLCTVNPRLIYCSGSGYGESGPYVSRPGQDMLIQGLTGRGDGPPVPTGSGFADQVGAMNMVYAILVAPYWRERSGEGQEVRIDLMSGLLAHRGQEMLAAMNFGRDFQRPNSGIGHPGMDAPFGVYPARDGWVTIAMNPFRVLVDVLGDPSLLEYDEPASLFDRRDEVWGRIAALTAAWDRAALMQAMLARDIWCGEVKTHLEAQDDPQVRHLGAIQELHHPTAGTVRVVGSAIRMSATPPAITRAPPLVGQQSREVLLEFGFGEDEVAALLASGAVAQADHA